MVTTLFSILAGLATIFTIALLGQETHSKTQSSTSEKEKKSKSKKASISSAPTKSPPPKKVYVAVGLGNGILESHKDEAKRVFLALCKHGVVPKSNPNNPFRDDTPSQTNDASS